MPPELQPVLLEDFVVEWPGFSLRRVALNRHMPRVEKLSEHSHRHSQVLLYLRGRGVQHFGEEQVSVARGSLVAIPPGQAHSFEKERHLRPVCLAIDFEDERELSGWSRDVLLEAGELARVERLLVALHEERAQQKVITITAVSIVLQLLAIVEEACRGRAEPRPGPAATRVKRALERVGLTDATPRKIADAIGVSLDHLNRLLGAECGLTVGGLLKQERREEACRLLRNTDRPVGVVGSAVGIDDPNYFARWFREETGQSPSRWRAAMRSG